VFFYQRRVDEPANERGFRGIYKIKGEPFFDDHDIEWNSYKVLGKCPHCGKTFPEKADYNKEIAWCRECKKRLPFGEHILPNRVLIEPLLYFEKSVSDNTAYVDQTDPGTLWTMLFRKIYGPGRQRSVTPILPEEANKLIRLLKRVNENLNDHDIQTQPYIPSDSKPIKVQLGPGPKVKYEHVLQAWLMENLDKDIPVLREVIGPPDELEWFGNEIIYGIGGDKVDVLTLHHRDGVRYKATVFELKDGNIGKEDVTQVERYSYWVSQLVTANVDPPINSLILKPVLIGNKVDDRARSKVNSIKTYELRIPYPRGDCTVKIFSPVLLTYEVKCGIIEFEFS
jgi:DNA-directed RNA polymerase subunit RPC12/RpoP